MKNNIISRIRGAMYGVAVGDALGAPLEFLDAETIKKQHGTVRDMIGGGWLGVRPGEFTDDTQMTLAVAHGIVEEPDDPIEAIGEHFVSWMKAGPKDVGGTCGSSIRRAMSVAKNPSRPSKNAWLNAATATHMYTGGRSAGNGTLMRTAYVGLYYKGVHETMLKARQISKMTHYDDETAVDCAVYSAVLNRMVDENSLRARKELLIHYTCRAAYCKGRYSYERLSKPSSKLSTSAATLIPSARSRAASPVCYTGMKLSRNAGHRPSPRATAKSLIRSAKSLR